MNESYLYYNIENVELFKKLFEIENWLLKK